MSFDDLLGRHVTMTVARFSGAGALLSSRDEGGAERPLLLLPRRETPEGARVGDTLEVFVYLDSEDRPIATTLEPHVRLGEVAFLEITSVSDVGAFADWGLVKELMVPFALQTRELHVGDRQPIGLVIDKTGRLAGTMRVAEMLEEQGDFEEDERVWGEAWRKTPGIGVFVIVERRFVGLLPESEPHRLSRGEAAKFRVSNVLPDGKIELSLRGHAHDEIEGDASRVLEVLSAKGAAVSEKASPEQIRERFGLSKKAFKRAVGRLIREGKVSVGPGGVLELKAPRAPVG